MLLNKHVQITAMGRARYDLRFHLIILQENKTEADAVPFLGDFPALPTGVRLRNFCYSVMIYYIYGNKIVHTKNMLVYFLVEFWFAGWD